VVIINTAQQQAPKRYASPELQRGSYVSLIAALSPFFLQLVVFAKFGLFYVLFVV